MALHRTRIDLLRKGNISALVYTPYCSMDLALELVPRGPSQVTAGLPAVSPDIANYHIDEKESVAT